MIASFLSFPVHITAILGLGRFTLYNMSEVSNFTEYAAQFSVQVIPYCYWQGYQYPL